MVISIICYVTYLIMNDVAVLTEDIVGLLRGIRPQSIMRIDSQTKILSGLDLDSLEILEFVEILRHQYEIDFLLPPYGIAHLATPETIATAVLGARNEVVKQMSG
jgi:hypothetical protein